MKNTNRAIDAALKARDSRLARRSVVSIAGSLGALSKRWLRREDRYRRRAVSFLVGRSGFTREMADQMLDAIFSEMTTTGLRRLLRSEIGDARALDTFRPHKGSGSMRRAFGPRLITHVFSANVPNPAILSFVFGMLVKSVNLGKLSRRDAGFLEVYLQSLRSHDAELAASNVLLPPADERSLDAAFARSDLAVVYGHAETIEAVKRRLPISCGLAAYGPRTSFSVILASSMVGPKLAASARATARDVWMLDQRGCLSPSTVFVQSGARATADRFAQALSDELGRLGSGLIACDAFDARRLGEQRTIRFLKGEAFSSFGKNGWSVLFAQRPELHSFRPARVVYVHPFRDLAQLDPILRAEAGRLQAASVEGSTVERARAAEFLADLGVNRICRAGRMQNPPLTWNHDGRPNLAGWLRWADLEN